MTKFNIFNQLDKELNEFFEGSVKIAGENKTSEQVRYGLKDESGYTFNQNDYLDLIDLYYNSKFKTGRKDIDGQDKVFLNISRFRSDIASKQVDLDVKNFNFIPGESDAVWGAYFMNKRFAKWAKEIGFGEIINETVNDYPKYGTVVLKRFGHLFERVPIRTLRNPHNCKDLKSARFVIEEHKDMTWEEITSMPHWNTDELDFKFDKLTTVYERYGSVPMTWYKEYKGEKIEDGDDRKVIDTMSILVKEADKKAKNGVILFCEEVKERPYEEVHWSKIDGRWLGIGEIENQFDNQVMRNMIANLRKRGLEWATRKIFQSTDKSMVNNLIRDVKDGQVLKIMPGGNLTEVPMPNQNLAEFNTAEQEWETNSDQKAFTYEVATGESLPSGTPFRLGVVLSNAVNSHFELKREKLGLFYKRLIKNHLFDMFKKDNKDAHTITLFASEKGVRNLKKALADMYLRERRVEAILSGQIPNEELERAAIEMELQQKDILFGKIPERFYDNLKNDVELIITGESVDMPKQIETLTNIFNVLSGKGDPRADIVLEQIISLTGNNLEAILGGDGQFNQPMQTSPQSQAINTGLLQQFAQPNQTEQTL